VRANQNLPEGTYKIQFGDYGTCKAWGSGRKHLDGSDNIPGNNISVNKIRQFVS
jgi:hypothetical protein